jgi:hypothetical protein
MWNLLGLLNRWPFGSPGIGQMQCQWERGMSCLTGWRVNGPST